MEYKELKRRSFYTGPVIHTEIPEILNDINHFFKNVKEYLKYNSPGMRKVILIGEPGTGKSSIAFKIALEFSKNMNVTYCNNSRALFMHANNLSKSKIPGIIVCEDADTVLNESGSEMLNFLSGVRQKRNLAGTYFVFTSNHPEYIDSRILKRPGRIDRVFNIDSLKDDEAMKCAELYFGKNIIKSSKKAGDPKWEVIFNNLTGAQIKEIAHTTRTAAVSRQVPVNAKLILQIIEEMRKHYEALDKYETKESSRILRPKRRSMGFSQEVNVDDEFYNNL
jgi:SpoVK/Ycf46/Vps4 family AAA+-type ATPase